MNVSELIDARRAIRHWKAKSEKLEAQLDKAHSDIHCMVKKAAAKHRPAYDEQSTKIMKLQARLEAVRNEIPCLPHEAGCSSNVGSKCECPIADIKSAIGEGES